MWKKLKSWGQNERRGFVMLRCAKHERDEICRVLQGPARSRSGLYTGVMRPVGSYKISSSDVRHDHLDIRA
jgi:hypothetical protein